MTDDADTSGICIREGFNEVDDALDEKLSATIWEGPADALMLTLAQQGLMVTSANQSWLYDTQPVMNGIPGME